MKYFPVIKKVWEELIWAIDDSVRLGWVQRVGHDLRCVTADDTMEYSVGAFLLTASEIIKLRGQ